MVQGIAAECMHNSDQSIEKGVRSLNIYDFYTISTDCMCYIFNFLK